MSSLTIAPATGLPCGAHFAKELARNKKEEDKDGPTDPIADEIGALRLVYRAVSAAQCLARSIAYAERQAGAEPALIPIA